MAEYLRAVTVPASSALTVPIQMGQILGVYSPDGPVSISWDYNGKVGPITEAVKVWEPNQGFAPGPFSSLIFENTGDTAVTVSIRCT